MTRRGAAFAAALLIFTEYISLSLTFDVEPLRRGTDLAAGIGWLGALAPLLVLGAAAFAIVRPRDQRSHPWTAPAGFGAFLAAHAASFGALWWTTSRLRDGPAWSLAWVALAFLSPLCLALAVAAPRAIVGVLRDNRVAIGRASLIAVAGFGLAAASPALWPVLVEITLIGAATMLMAWGEAPLLLPERRLLGIGDFIVEVSRVCSGMEGIGLILVFLTAYILLDRRRLRLPAAWIALPLAVVAVLFANVLRIAALVWLGGHGWPDVAMGGFHSKAGWVLFSSVALGATALTGYTFGHAEPQPRSEVADARPAVDAAPFLIPLLAIIASQMVSGLFVTEAPVGHPIVVCAGIGALLWARRRWPPGLLETPAWTPALVYGALAYVLWLATLSEPDFTDARRLATTMGHDVWWVAFKLIGAVAVVPIAEELAFRGFLQRRLSSRSFGTLRPGRSTAWGVIGASVVFGLLHQDVTAGIGAGLIYGWLYRRTGRLSDAIAAHAVTNALLAANVLLGNAWWLWS